MIKQKTISKSTTTHGVGLHSGAVAKLTFYPAPPNHGIVFRRVDQAKPNEIPAHFELVSTTELATRLTNDHVSVTTVEHLLSAFVGLSIDNVLVEVNKEEIPIMDGSAAVFTHLLNEAGIVEQDQPKKFIKILKPCKVGDDNAWASLEPFDGYRIKFTIEFNHPLFKAGPQWIEFHLNAANYSEEISSARTFGFMKDLEALKARNLAKAGGISNAIVLDDLKVVNPEGLRFQDEMVRHKVLDALGDLSLMGGTLIGAFSGYKSGHRLTNQLLRKLMQSKDAWEIVTLP